MLGCNKKVYGAAKLIFLISWEPIMGKLSNLKHKYFVRNRIEWRKEKKFVLRVYPQLLSFFTDEAALTPQSCSLFG